MQPARFRRKDIFQIRFLPIVALTLFLSVLLFAMTAWGLSFLIKDQLLLFFFACLASAPMIIALQILLINKNEIKWFMHELDVISNWITGIFSLLFSIIVIFIRPIVSFVHLFILRFTRVLRIISLLIQIIVRYPEIIIRRVEYKLRKHITPYIKQGKEDSDESLEHERPS